MRLRPATPADLTAILALQQACDGAPHWSEPIWRSLLQEQQSHAHPRQAILAEQHEGLPGPQLLGFIVFTAAREVAEIEDLCVQLTFRRRGTARALCLAAMASAASLGALCMELEVRAANAAALSLYRSLGFAQQAVRRGYYRDPVDDAVLMSAPLSVPPIRAAKV